MRLKASQKNPQKSTRESSGVSFLIPERPDGLKVPLPGQSFDLRASIWTCTTSQASFWDDFGGPNHDFFCLLEHRAHTEPYTIWWWGKLICSCIHTLSSQTAYAPSCSLATFPMTQRSSHCVCIAVTPTSSDYICIVMTPGDCVSSSSSKKFWSCSHCEESTKFQAPLQCYDANNIWLCLQCPDSNKGSSCLHCDDS